MTGGTRELKRRIKSVGSTRQITGAMNLVASSKLNRSKERFSQIRPFADMTLSVIAKVASGAAGIKHPYITPRQEIKKAAVIVLAGDRGLCGGYNVNVCKLATAAADGTPCEYYAVGSKAYEYLKKHKCEIYRGVRGISEKPEYEDARAIGEEILQRYADGAVDEVYLVYTSYKSSIAYEPKSIRLLPFDIESLKTEGSGQAIFEPSAGEVLGYVLPKYLNTVIYGGMAEAALCEQSARMTAMDSATDNADDMLEKLQTSYNRARQGAITQEITEIIGGSDI